MSDQHRIVRGPAERSTSTDGARLLPSWAGLVVLLALLGGCNGSDDPAAGTAGTAARPPSEASAPAREGHTSPATTRTAADGTTAATQPAPDEPPAQAAQAGHRQQDAQTEAAPDPRLFDAWVADNVDTKIGPATIKLVFQRRGPVHILAWSELPLVGQVRDREAPFTVTDHTIHSDAIRDGTTVRYHFNGQGELVIEYQDGQTVTFRRAAEE